MLVSLHVPDPAAAAGKQMKLGIVGSREFPDLKMVEKYINSLPKSLTLITGDARGVDKTVTQVGARRGMVVDPLKKNYEKHGSGAPFVRNDRIVRESDAVVAFWDGKSPGTQDVMERALKARKLRWIFMPGNPPKFGDR